MPRSIPVPTFSPTATFCVVLALVAIVAGLAGTIYLRRLYAEGGAARTWVEFFFGPGALQGAALAVGMLVAALGSVAGPWGEAVSSGASVIRWQADGTKQPAFMTEYVDVSSYRYFDVLSHVAAPKDGLATVVIYGVDESGHSGSVRRLPAHAGDWSLWETRNAFKRIRIGVDRPDSGSVATNVEITLVLAQSPPQQLQDVAARSIAPAKK